MKNIGKSIVLIGALFASSKAVAQTNVIANYDFNSASGYPVAASSTTTGITSSATSSLTFTLATGVATGTMAFTSNTAGSSLGLFIPAGTSGGEIAFQLSGASLSNYQGYKVYFQSKRNSTGPTTVNVAYSVDGTNYTTLSSSYAINTSFTEYVVDLSSATQINNNTTVYVKLIYNASTSSTGGALLDNVQFQGTLNTGNVYTDPWINSGNDIGFMGRVGIGNVYPQSKLDVTGDARISTSLNVGGTTTLNTTVINGPLTLNSGTAAINPCIKMVVVDGNGNVVPLDGTAALQIDAAADGTACPTAAPIPLVWNTYGNHVNSNFRWIGTIENFDFNVRTNNIYRMSVKNNGDIGLGSFGGNNYNNSGAKFQMYINNSGDINLGATPTNTTFAMTVKANGSVGIGTLLSNNPNNYKLAVNGTIGCRELKVEISSTTWSDFVFQKNYKLMPLKDVEAFIIANQHLPNVPSNADVDSNGGINVAQMESKLLEKVEELTLYIIEQNKKIEALEKEVAQLKNN